jgi:hypothetical protein
MMQALLIEILGGWARAALIALSAYLVQHHLVTATQGDQLTSELFTHISLLLPGVLALAWTAIQKYRSRILLLTALQMPAGSSEETVARNVAAGNGAPLSGEGK